jgi:hypothetical protein
MEKTMRTLKTEELNLVAGAGDPCCTKDCPEKGNNGWGNGLDTTNNGSPSGATAVTKNSGNQDGGPGDKFEGR